MKKHLCAKDVLHPGLKDFFHQIPKFLHLKSINVKNVLIGGWILKPSDYPSVSCTSFEESAPSPLQGQEITNQILLAPCKISFSFLLQVYKYTKFQFLRRDGWTQAMTKVYLWTCCMRGDVSKFFLIMVNEVKKNNALETIISLPVLLWLQLKELGIKMEQSSDAPMHMLFLGVTKHLMAHVDCLFEKK
jgi:hypothetical protein